TDMAFLGNDRWRAAFDVPESGVYEYTITAWPDPFLTWRHDLGRWTDPDDVLVALQVGAALVADTARRARGADARVLRDWKARLQAPREPERPRAEAVEKA